MTRDTVTVAVLGPVFGYPGPPVFDGPVFEDQGEDLPYAKRVKVEVEVTEITPLGEIIDTAAARIGITNPRGGRVCDELTGIVFYEADDEVSFKWREQPWPRVIRLADEAGLPSWSVLWTEMRYGELVSASDANLVVGDPRRPYFWPVIPQGGGLQTFVISLRVLWSAWEYVLAGYGTFDLVRRVRRFHLARRIGARVKRAEKAIEQADWAMPWSKRLQRPHDFFDQVTGQPRTAEEIASLLGCPIEQAEAMLWGMGFSCDREGLWVVGGDAAASVLAESVQMIRQLGRAPEKGAIMELFLQLEGESDDSDQTTKSP